MVREESNYIDDTSLNIVLINTYFTLGLINSELE